MRRPIEAEPRRVQVRVRSEMRQVNTLPSSLDWHSLSASSALGPNLLKSVCNVLLCREKTRSIVQESGTKLTSQRSAELSVRKQGHLSGTALLA